MTGPKLLGVVNVTPDSFYDGGRYLALEAAVDRALRLAGEGADALDLGGESTRPGAPAVALDAELARVVPAVRELVKRVAVPVSVDTQKAAIARAALDAGASWINDVSALRADPGMARVCAQAGCTTVLMHIGGGGTPATMQHDPVYDDVVGDILAFFRERIAAFEAAGGKREKLILDPGIGFGKTLKHNLDILRRVAEFSELGLPLLLGTSRKSFLGRILAGQHEDQADLPNAELPPPSARLHASLASALWCAERGVAWLRVHDVAQTREALRVREVLA